MKNRIEIMNARSHGGDESCCYSRIYGADDEADITEEVREELEMDPDPDGDAEGRGDWGNVLYVNDLIVIADGDVREHKGRRFRVSITEVK